MKKVMTFVDYVYAGALAIALSVFILTVVGCEGIMEKADDGTHISVTASDDSTVNIDSDSSTDSEEILEAVVIGDICEGCRGFGCDDCSNTGLIAK